MAQYFKQGNNVVNEYGSFVATSNDPELTKIYGIQNASALPTYGVPNSGSQIATQDANGIAGSSNLTLPLTSQSPSVVSNTNSVSRDWTTEQARLNTLQQSVNTINSTDQTSIDTAGVTAGMGYDALIQQAQQNKIKGMATATQSGGRIGGFMNTQVSGQSAISTTEGGNWVGAGGSLYATQNEYDAQIASLQSQKMQAIAQAKSAQQKYIQTGKQADFDNYRAIINDAQSYDDKQQQLAINKATASRETNKDTLANITPALYTSLTGDTAKDTQTIQDYAKQYNVDPISLYSSLLTYKTDQQKTEWLNSEAVANVLKSTTTGGDVKLPDGSTAHISGATGKTVEYGGKVYQEVDGKLVDTGIKTDQMTQKDVLGAVEKLATDLSDSSVLENYLKTGKIDVSGITPNTSNQEYLYGSFQQTLTPEGNQAFQSLGEKDKLNVMQLIQGDALSSDIAKGMGGAKYASTLLGLAKKVDPTYSENVNKQRYAFKTQWNNPNGKVWNARNSLNTALQHIAELKDNATALNNSWSTDKNLVVNVLKKHTGQQSVTDFNYTLGVLSAEIASAYKGGAATDQEMENERQNIFNTLSNSQMSSVINLATRLLGDKVSVTADGYKDVMGKYPDNPVINNQSLQLLKNSGVNVATLESMIKRQTNPTVKLGGFSKQNTDTDSAFVEKSIKAQPKKYQQLLDETPSGHIPVVDNKTGEVGYILPTEFDNNLYTKL